MAKELPYFKFYVSEWILGRIFDQPDRVQGAFMVAVCHYWHKKCNVSVVDFKKKIGRKRFDLLHFNKFIDVQNDRVLIPFLDEQFLELSQLQLIRAKTGKAGGKASAQAKGTAKVKDIEVDKEVEVDKDEEGMGEYTKPQKGFQPPLISEVTEFFKKNGYSFEAAIQAFNYYKDGDWHNGEGRKLNNWKQAMRANWFRPEFKTKEKTGLLSTPSKQ